MQKRNLYRIGTECIVLAACVLLFFSCLGFDIGDWPSRYMWPHNEPVSNWCGVIGAFFSYYLMYYIGPGVLILLGAGALGTALRFFGREITQPVLRGAGVALLVAAASGSVYLIWPHGEGSFPMGNGGVLGITVGQFLRAHFAMRVLGALGPPFFCDVFPALQCHPRASVSSPRFNVIPPLQRHPRASVSSPRRRGSS